MFTDVKKVLLLQIDVMVEIRIKYHPQNMLDAISKPPINVIHMSLGEYKEVAFRLQIFEKISLNINMITDKIRCLLD